jgi:predicted TIM-barrel fold metal-dependent hydrolase
VQYAELRGQLNLWVPDRAERRVVLADTPAKLFRFQT